MNLKCLSASELQAVVPQLLSIEADAAFPHWGKADFLGEQTEGVELWLATDQHAQPLGFISLGVVADEGEIRNLGVFKKARGRGVGKGLVRHAQFRAEELGASRLFLEVRVTNMSALTLYQRCGFTELTRRVAYYRAPQGDALVMACSICSNPQGSQTRLGYFDVLP